MRKENKIRMESNRRLWGEGRAGTLPRPPRPQRMWRRPWSAGGKQATPASGRPPGSLNPRNREGARSYLLKGELYLSDASIPKEEDGPGPGWNNSPGRKSLEHTQHRGHSLRIPGAACRPEGRLQVPQPPAQGAGRPPPSPLPGPQSPRN